MTVVKELNGLAGTTAFKPGLEGVVAFQTEIAEPDRDGGALRYRGVDIEDLAGYVTFGDVWALLTDGRFGHGLPPAEPFPLPVHTGDVRVDVQAALLREQAAQGGLQAGEGGDRAHALRSRTRCGFVAAGCTGGAEPGGA